MAVRGQVTGKLAFDWLNLLIKKGLVLDILSGQFCLEMYYKLISRSLPPQGMSYVYDLFETLLLYIPLTTLILCNMSTGKINPDQ